MMKVYFGFDDTDTHDSQYGTGKLVRWFQNDLPQGFECRFTEIKPIFLLFADRIPEIILTPHFNKKKVTC